MVIVRGIAFRYQTQVTQPMCVNEVKLALDYFKVSNGVRQGDVLSPKLFAIYFDDSALCSSGCYINENV